MLLECIFPIRRSIPQLFFLFIPTKYSKAWECIMAEDYEFKVRALVL